MASIGASPTTQPRAKYEPPDGSVYHGLCLNDYWAMDQFEAHLKRYREHASDRALVLHSWFAHCQEHGKWFTWEWMPKTPDGKETCGPAKSHVEMNRAHGFVPVIAWTLMNYGDEKNSPRLQDLVAGKYDWYLDDWINGVKAFKDPIFIRLSHEMDGDWYPYSEGWKDDPTRNKASDYVAYWRYVVNRFRNAGVTNVAWVWCVNGDRSGGKDWQDYYPGDEYVDWLGIDVYSARNPKDVISQFTQMYGHTHKPIMIPEGGTIDDMNKYNTQFTSNAAWVKELFDTIDTTKQIKALCWFEWSPENNVERDAAQLAEYKKRIAEPRYGAKFVP